MIAYETDPGALGYWVFLWILGVSWFSDRWTFVLVWVVEKQRTREQGNKRLKLASLEHQTEPWIMYKGGTQRNIY